MGRYIQTLLNLHLNQILQSFSSSTSLKKSVMGLLPVLLTATVTLLSGVESKHVGCYYGVWAYTRPGLGEFWPEDIDVSLCDVIYYGFGNVLNDTYEVCSWDPWFDMAMSYGRRLGVLSLRRDEENHRAQGEKSRSEGSLLRRRLDGWRLDLLPDGLHCREQTQVQSQHHPLHEVLRFRRSGPRLGVPWLRHVARGAHQP